MADKEISGNIQSLKDSVLDEMRGLYETEPDTSFLPDELAARMAVISNKINREIAVYLNRKGTVLDVSVGDSSTVTLSEIDGRRSKIRLSGIRCIHTHPNGDPNLSAVDINSLLELNMDAMIALGTREGVITGITAALPRTAEDSGDNDVDIFGPFAECGDMEFLWELIRERDRTSGIRPEVIKGSSEKAILVGIRSDGGKSLDELSELAYTAGLVVLEKVLQSRTTRDPAFLIGKGKVRELSLMRQAMGADTLVFDEELTGAQIRNIEEMTGAKVLDRTMLILDIFAQRAKSSEGKLQVELAQLKYRLPRLTGLGGKLSRLGGGIGTRGPGEKKLETDRRHIRRRMSALEDALSDIAKRRGLTRESRKKNAIPVAALVGYTNSGKSTLLNRLCKSDVLAEDKLFATLDPTTRRLLLPNGREILLVDTVGFIRKLPHDLVEAFKSTLEEAVSADLLLHVVDMADEEAEEHIRVTESILESLGASGKPTLLVFNKMDSIREDYERPVLKYGNNTIEVSALTGEGIDSLLSAIEKALASDEEEVTLLVPYTEGWVSSYIRDYGTLLSEEYRQEGISLTVRIKKSRLERIREFADKD